MSTENQPVVVLSVYTTYAWIQPIGGSEGITLSIADGRYLNKVTADTAISLETFNGGIKTNNISLVSGTELNLPPSNASYLRTDNIVSDSGTGILIGSNTMVGGEIQLGNTNSFTRVYGELLVNAIKTRGIFDTLSIGENVTSTGAIIIGTDVAPMDIKASIMNIGTVVTTLTTTALSIMNRVRILGTGSPTVDLPIGNTTGNSSLSVTMCRKSASNTTLKDVFQLTSPPSFPSKPISQYGELVISGMNTTTTVDVVYTRKSSFIIQNTSGTQVVTETVNNDYSSSGAVVVTYFFNGATKTTIRVQVPTTLSPLTSTFIATLTMYPGITSIANQNYIIEAV
jgi:hypothetical protein